MAAEATTAADLARMCGLLPLALRIAAANLLDQPGRDIADYLAELTERSRLAGLAVDGDPEAAVRAAFDTSYAVLDPDDRRLAATAAALAGDIGERRLQADALNTLASVHLQRGSLPQAQDSYRQALELARATQSRYPEVVTLLGLATPTSNSTTLIWRTAAPGRPVPSPAGAATGSSKARR